MVKKILLMVVVAVYSLSVTSTVFPYNSNGLPGSIKSPEELANWLHNEFTYELKFPDYKQTLDETLKKRRGDCEDFALLSHMILNDLGIKNEVIIIKYRQMNIMHAVCIFKYGNKYSFMSNREMVRTNGLSINDAITETFPDWDKLTYLTADGQFGRTIERGYAVGIGASTLSTPSMYGMLLGLEHRDIGMIKFMLESRLSSLARSGMRFSALTFRTIFKDSSYSHVRFLFDKMQLMSGGFHVVCLAEDEDGARIYHALFSIGASRKGFTVAVYPETDRKRVSQFNNIIPHPLTENSSDIKFKLTNGRSQASL